MAEAESAWQKLDKGRRTKVEYLIGRRAWEKSQKKGVALDPKKWDGDKEVYLRTGRTIAKLLFEKGYLDTKVMNTPEK